MAERKVVFKMFDFQFDWKDDLNTGVEDIDRQHRELFRIGRDIEQLILTGCVGVEDKELLKIICDLREYVSYHFYEEEKFMKSHNYKDYEVHKKLHEQFKDEITHINYSYIEKNPFEGVKMMKTSLQDWIFQHMLITDKDMVDEILGKNNK